MDYLLYTINHGLSSQYKYVLSRDRHLEKKIQAIEVLFPLRPSPQRLSSGNLNFFIGSEKNVGKDSGYSRSPFVEDKRKASRR